MRQKQAYTRVCEVTFWCICRSLSLAIKQLDDHLALALGSLAMVPAGLTLQVAAVLLDSPEDQAKSKLDQLGKHGLVSYDKALQSYCIHPDVRQAALDSTVRHGVSQTETRSELC